jgi:hypothetical protein
VRKIPKRTWLVLPVRRKKEEEGAKKRIGDIATLVEARATPQVFARLFSLLLIGFSLTTFRIVVGLVYLRFRKSRMSSFCARRKPSIYVLRLHR